MSQHSRRPLVDQVESLRRQFAQAPGLPFRDVLTAAEVEDAFRAEGVESYACVYTPLTTVRLLLSQALDPDPSLGQAVSRFLAERAAEGKATISANTGA